MAYWVYNVGLLVGLPIILAVLLAKARCRPGLPYRMGWRTPDRPAGASEVGTIWVHAVSLGEVVAATPLVKALRVRHPARPIIVSTVTETGREAVLQRLSGVASHCYAPMDFPWVVDRFLRELRPACYLFVETELWPNLLRALARRDIPTVLVNGRLSSRSFKRQQWPGIRGLYRGIVAGLTACLMQSDRDATRIVALGAHPERVTRIGNIKYDQPLPTVRAGQLDAVEQWIRLRSEGPVLVAGSTHPVEEAMVFEACEQLRRAHPSLTLVVAPRHTERVAEVEQELARRGIAAARRSLLETAGQARSERDWVLILDSRGELGAVYQYATIAFVGGTLVPIGGHNVLEPAAWGKPVVFGPYTDHSQDIADTLLDAGGGSRVSTVPELVSQLASWCANPGTREEVGRRARQMVQDNQGAVERALAVIDRHLPPAQPGSMPPVVVARTQPVGSC